MLNLHDLISIASQMLTQKQSAIANQENINRSITLGLGRVKFPLHIPNFKILQEQNLAKVSSEASSEFKKHQDSFKISCIVNKWSSIRAVNKHLVYIRENVNEMLI